MMAKRVYGRTKSGQPIDDDLVERLADEAERGYGAAQLPGRRRGRGRPPLGASAKKVESVRMDPELRELVAQRAAADGVTASDVIRRAVAQYLRSA